MDFEDEYEYEPELPPVDNLSFIPLYDKAEVSICYHGEALNKLYITTDAGANVIFQIQKLIKTYVTSDKVLVCYDTDTYANTGDIVLCTFQGGKEYFRAYVKHFHIDEIEGQIATVGYLDFGGQQQVYGRDLVVCPQNIAEFSRCGILVMLKDVPETSDAILWDDFLDYIDSRQYKYKIEIVDYDNDETPIVTLECKDGFCVNKEIVELGKWSWERLWNAGVKTDIEMFRQRQYPFTTYSNMATNHLEVGKPVQLEIVQVLTDEQFVAIPASGHYDKQKLIMMTKMNNYFAQVQPSPFECRYGEVHGFKKPAGDWIRCAQYGDYVFAIDEGTWHSRNGNIQRALPWDFARIPHFTIHCKSVNHKLAVGKKPTALFKSIIAVPTRFIKSCKTYEVDVTYFLQASSSCQKK